MTLPSFSVAIVGADHPNKRGPSRRFDLAVCAPGEPLELRPEPSNPKDEYAVAVYSKRNVQLGYLPADRAPWIAAMITQGRELAIVFQGLSAFGGWARIAFDGDIPELPATPTRPKIEECDFWPDEIPPDE